MAQPTQEGLVRGISRWSLIAVAINGIIGAGIFGIPSKVFAQTGAYSLLAFAVCKLIPMVLFIAAGLFFINPGNYSFAEAPGYAAFSQSVLMLIYAFTGFEMAVIPAGEIRDPRRNLPLAILTAIAVVAVLYIGIQFVCIGTLPTLATSQRPIADASALFLGRAGAALIAAGVIVSIIGNLSVLILAASRLPFAMGEGGEVPRWLGRTPRRLHTAPISILIT